MCDPKLNWREACDNDEVRGEEVFVSSAGEKSYVRRDSDIRVLYEGRPDLMAEMRLGELAAEYRLLKPGSKDTENIRYTINNQHLEMGIGNDNDNSYDDDGDDDNWDGADEDDERAYK